MTTYVIGDVTRIRFAVSDMIKTNSIEISDKHELLQSNIVLPDNIVINDDGEDYFSEYDDDDEGEWFSDHGSDNDSD